MERAKVGDIIVITHPMMTELRDVECIVVDCDVCPVMAENISEIVWAHINRKNHGGIFWTFHDGYEIVRRATTDPSPLVSCQDCKGTGQITLFTSIVKCKCCDGDERNEKAKMD